MHLDSLFRARSLAGRALVCGLLLPGGLPRADLPQIAPARSSPLWAGTPVEPQSPDGLLAVHKDGQTFLTWRENTTLAGESYRLYRSRTPIASSADLATAELFLPVPGSTSTVWEDSGEFYADRVRSETSGGTDVARYLQRLVVPDPADPTGRPRRVDANVGVFVHSLSAQDFDGACVDAEASEVGFYAVTTVDANGIESPIDPARNVFALSEACGEHRPLRIRAETGETLLELEANIDTWKAIQGDGQSFELYVCVQYMNWRDWNVTMHAPNPLNCFWGESGAQCPDCAPPTDPALQNAIQYAYAYTVSEPTCHDGCDPATDPGCLWPVVLFLHPHAGDRVKNAWEYPCCDPIFNPTQSHAVRILPIDVADTWWFGFHDSSHDYREPGIPTSDRVVNYTELRLLSMVSGLLADPHFGSRVDSDRIYVAGTSMGGAGALALALRYPDVFAAADIDKPVTDFEGFVAGTVYDPSSCDLTLEEELLQRLGDPTVTSPTVDLLTVGTWGQGLPDLLPASFWDWQNHAAELDRLAEREIAPFAIRSGVNDFPYETQVAPFFGALVDAGRTCAGATTCDGHTPSLFAVQPPGFGGPVQEMPNDCSAQSPFAGYSMRRTESVPGFSSPTPAFASTPDDFANQLAACATENAVVSFFSEIDWASSWNPWDLPVLDLPDLWSCSLRCTPGAVLSSVSVTPRRNTLFRPAPGQLVTWQNVDRQTGFVLQEGVLSANALGRVSVPSVLLTEAGTRLLLQLGPTPTLGYSPSDP